jgi:hypothetical protein
MSGAENVTKIYIYSNSDLDLGPIEPKSNLKHPPSISNLCIKFEYRRFTETKVIVRKQKRNEQNNRRTDGITDKEIAIYPSLSGGIKTVFRFYSLCKVK